MSHSFNAYTANNPPEATWTPESLSGMKSTFERQYSRDKLVDMVFNEQRRVRKAVTGPAEGYHHPNEINGVRLLRKGRGVPPTASRQELLDSKEAMPRKGKVQPSGDVLATQNQAGSLAKVEEQPGEELWPVKGKKIVQGPPDQKEQLWPCKGKKIIAGKSHPSNTNMPALMSWDPDTEQKQAPVQEPPTNLQKFGKRVMPYANRSSIVFG